MIYSPQGLRSLWSSENPPSWRGAPADPWNNIWDLWEAGKDFDCNKDGIERLNASLLLTLMLIARRGSEGQLCPPPMGIRPGGKFMLLFLLQARRNSDTSNIYNYKTPIKYL